MWRGRRATDPNDQDLGFSDDDENLSDTDIPATGPQQSGGFTLGAGPPVDDDLSGSEDSFGEAFAEMRRDADTAVQPPTPYAAQPSSTAFEESPAGTSPFLAGSPETPASEPSPAVATATSAAGDVMRRLQQARAQPPSAPAPAPAASNTAYVSGSSDTPSPTSSDDRRRQQQGGPVPPMLLGQPRAPAAAAPAASAVEEEYGESEGRGCVGNLTR